MKQYLDVIAEFSQGRVIPRRIRYYDLDSATYVQKDIRALAYEIHSRRQTTYGVRFADFEEGILCFLPRAGAWSFTDHL